MIGFRGRVAVVFPPFPGGHFTLSLGAWGPLNKKHRQIMNGLMSACSTRREVPALHAMQLSPGIASSLEIDGPHGV